MVAAEVNESLFSEWCRVLSTIELPRERSRRRGYQFRLDVQNTESARGEDFAQIALAFNVKDDENFDFVMIRQVMSI